MDTWQLQDAKNQFSEVVRKARRDGPQIVTRRGVETVVVISHEEYIRLSRPKRNLVEMMRESPLVQAGLDLERRKDEPRGVDL